MSKAIALLLGAAALLPSQQRSPRFSVELSGDVDVARFMPSAVGTSWTYRYQESLGCSCGTRTCVVTTTWTETLEIVGREVHDQGVWLPLRNTISDFSAQRSKGCTEPWTPESHRPDRPPGSVLLVHGRRVYRLGDIATAKLELQLNQLETLVPDLSFPLTPDLRWSDRGREEKDLAASQIFELGLGPAPNPGLNYWVVVGPEEVELNEGPVRAWHVVHATLGGKLHRWFVEGMGVVRESFRHGGSFWQRDSELLEFHRVR